MQKTFELRNLAREIWQAGVDAVDSERLVRQTVRLSGSQLLIGPHTLQLAEIGRIVVVGAGKAGAGMTAGLEQAVGADLLADKVSGWVNVPADCVRPLRKIHLHAARPAGLNEPTEAGVHGAREILRRITELTPADVCIVLISGGGSALLPAPVPEIDLEDKQRVTRLLMKAGANINELNTVRKQLSQIKGGRLAQACTAGRLFSLIISDVVGDPLEIIASGPTVPDDSTPAQAWEILHRYARDPAEIPRSVGEFLQEKSGADRPQRKSRAVVENLIVGNNQTAVAAAAEKARQLGFAVHQLGSDNRGIAAEEGRQLAELCLSIRDQGMPLAAPACVISGGEPVVPLLSGETLGKGGRNQELVLAALDRLWEESAESLAILSGGTDGEDGPTDAAGAICDADILAAARQQALIPGESLRRHDSYPFFAAIDGLLQTGPTHTNVMDLRIAIVR